MYVRKNPIMVVRIIFIDCNTVVKPSKRSKRIKRPMELSSQAYKCEPPFTMEKQARSILRTRYSRSPCAGTYVHLASACAAFHSAGTFGAHVELTTINAGATGSFGVSLRLPRTRQKLAALPTGKTLHSPFYRASPTGNTRIIAT